MGFDLEQHMRIDPHVEISREELELGLAPSIVSDALSEVQDSSHKVSTPIVYGTGNSKPLGAGSNGSIRAPSASATDLQQAEMVPAAFDPGSNGSIRAPTASATDLQQAEMVPAAFDPGSNGSIRAPSASATDLQQAEMVPAAFDSGSLADLTSWPQLSMCEASLKGSDGQEDLKPISNLNLRSDEVQEDETGPFRPPSNAEGASYSILPLERLAEYKHEASKSSPKITGPGNYAPICKESEHAKCQGKLVASAPTPGNDSQDVSFQNEAHEPLAVDWPKVTSEIPFVDRDHSNGKGSAETEFSGPTEAAQLPQSECEDPDFASVVMPKSFSGLFQSMLASDIPSYQLVETGIQPNGLTGATASVLTVKNQPLTNLVNTTTRLMLASLKQPPHRPDPPGLLQAEKELASRSRMKPNTALVALEVRPISTWSASQTSYRAARVASAATSVSAAASAAKSAVQAAEASIEALANLGINNGSLYQGKNSFMNPRPLKVACGNTPVAAGVKRTFQDQRSPVVKQTRGMNSTGLLDLIKVGSTVEVMPGEDGLQCCWFNAKVLSMTSKQALVVYDDLMTDDGCSHVEESFPVLYSREEDSFGTTVFAAQGWIRPVHPFSSSQKRGHAITVCEKWVVGDRVDAFVEDGWWEAIIEDLNEADETNITVHFPGDGSTTSVRTWNVRPSLVWRKGEWRPCRGDSVEQAYPPSKRQKTSLGKVEREQTKTKVATAGNPVPLHKKTLEPLAMSQTLRSGARRNDNKDIVLYSNERHTRQSLVTPTRELRSATRSNANVAKTKVPVKSSTAPVPKTRIAKATASLNGSSPLTWSQQLEVAVVPEQEWDVRRQSTRLQQKVVSPNSQDLGRGKTLSSRLSKKEALESAKDRLRRKTASRRSQHKEVMKTPVANDLAIVLLPETRSRTRSQVLAASKR